MIDKLEREGYIRKLSRSPKQVKGSIKLQTGSGSCKINIESEL